MFSINPLSFTHPLYTHGLSLSQSLCSSCMLTAWKCVPLVDLVDGLLLAGQNGLPPTPDILYLGCSYHVHSGHNFFPLGVQLGLKIK